MVHPSPPARTSQSCSAVPAHYFVSRNRQETNDATDKQYLVLPCVQKQTRKERYHRQTILCVTLCPETDKKRTIPPTNNTLCYLVSRNRQEKNDTTDKQYLVLPCVQKQTRNKGYHRQTIPCVTLCPETDKKQRRPSTNNTL